MENNPLKQLAKEWHESFGTDALRTEYDKYLHENFTADFFGGQHVNRSQYIEQDQAFGRAFSNNKVTVTEQIAEDNKVVSVMNWTAVHSEDLPDIPATGNSFTIRGIAIDYFQDGKIIKHLPLFDQFKMMQQLGAVAKPSL